MSGKLAVISRVIADLIEIGLFITGPLTITGFLGKLGWILDLTCHFRAQYFVVQSLCFLFFLIIKRWRWMAVAFLCASINVIQIAPLYIHRSHQDVSDSISYSKLRVLLINVDTSNTLYDRAVQYIKEVNPDLLALEEINEQWLSALSTVLTDFRFRKICPREDNFGIGLFSHIALQDPIVKYFGQAGVPSILSRIHIAEQPVTILLTHPLPPVSSEYSRLRNDQLDEIVSSRESFGDRLIVMGDLNMTSWSYYYKRFASRMKVYDSRRGFGVQPSWPTARSFMLIPLDHCLVSDNITVLDRRIGPNIGSDHYPIYIELGI